MKTSKKLRREIKRLKGKVLTLEGVQLARDQHDLELLIKAHEGEPIMVWGRKYVRPTPTPTGHERGAVFPGVESVFPGFETVGQTWVSLRPLHLVEYP